MPLQRRQYYLDALNIIACIAVTMLHASNSVFGNAGDAYWRACAITQSIFIFAVPIFFMISGANLIGYRKKYTTKKFFQKRASRIALVFIGCSALFYCIECFVPEPFAYTAREFSIAEFLRGFLANDINDTYWYFYALIGLYALCPILSLLANRPKLTLYLVAFCFITSILFPFLSRFSNGFDPYSNFTYSYFDSWILYFVLGYYLAHCFSRRIPSSLLAALFIGSVTGSAMLTIHANEPIQALGGNYMGYYSNTFSPLEFVAICSLFLFMKNFDNRMTSEPLRKTLKLLSSLSLGVYVLHILPLRFIDTVFPAMHESLLIKSLIIYAISALATLLWRTITGTAKTALKRFNS